MPMNHHDVPVITDILLIAMGLFCVSKDRLVQNLVQADLQSILRMVISKS